jgi:hypothetical protein
MSNTTITLPSGHELVLQATSMRNANALWQAVTGELSKAGLGMTGGTEGMAIGGLCALLASKTVYAAILVCMRGCTLDGLPLNEEAFEAEEYREDFTACEKEVLVFNIRPFAKGLGLESWLNMLLGFKSPTSNVTSPPV